MKMVLVAKLGLVLPRSISSGQQKKVNYLFIAGYISVIIAQLMNANLTVVNGKG